MAGPTRDKAGARDALIVVESGVIQPRLGQARVVGCSSTADVSVAEPVSLAPGIVQALLETRQLQPASSI